MGQVHDKLDSIHNESLVHGNGNHVDARNDDGMGHVVMEAHIPHFLPHKILSCRIVVRFTYQLYSLI
jgi:hypothetical protein